MQPLTGSTGLYLPCTCTGCWKAVASPASARRPPNDTCRHQRGVSQGWGQNTMRKQMMIPDSTCVVASVHENWGAIGASQKMPCPKRCPYIGECTDKKNTLLSGITNDDEGRSQRQIHKHTKGEVYIGDKYWLSHHSYERDKVARWEGERMCTFKCIGQ